MDNNLANTDNLAGLIYQRRKKYHVDVMEIAKAMGVHSGTAYDKMCNPKLLKLEELRELFRLLHFSDEEILETMGVQRDA